MTERGALKVMVVAAESLPDARLRSDLLDTWVAVTNAGGSVGFTAPAPVQRIAETLDAALARVASGKDLLAVLHDGERHVGMGLLVSRDSELNKHWRTVLRVMVHPRHQRSGSGRLMMDALRLAALELGLEQLQLTVRGGQGLERFYEGLGYRVVGRHPRAIRVAPGDDRDEVMLVMDLV